MQCILGVSSCPHWLLSTCSAVCYFQFILWEARRPQGGHRKKGIENYTETSPPCQERWAVLCHAQVPLQLAIRETSDSGTPIVAHQPDSPAAQAYQHISSLIYEKLQQTPTQLQPPLLGHASGVIIWYTHSQTHTPIYVYLKSQEIFSKHPPEIRMLSSQSEL